MTGPRRAATAAVVATLALLGATGSAGAQVRTGDDNIAVAVNTEDGASVFRLAFSVRQVSKDVVDQTNTAIALASCTDCQTVALAFQVVLVNSDADVVTPENLALAYNDQCVLCVTYASATQLVLGFDGRVRLSGEGWARLAALHRSLRELEDAAASMTVVELDAAVQAAKHELLAILDEELVVWEPGAEGTTTSTTSASTSSTSEDSTTTTDDTTTSDDSTTTSAEATTTSEPETTTSTAEPTTTTTAAA